MFYQVVLRTNCPAPLHDQLTRIVEAMDVSHAQDMVLQQLAQEYPSCAESHMWEIVSVSSHG
jgi:hypothetical protein